MLDVRWIALLTLVLCPAPSGTRETICVEFAVAEGTRLRKTFTRELELTTCEDDSLVEIGRWHDSQRIVLIDEYGALEGQVPDTITRIFVSIEMEHSHDWELSLPWVGSLSGTVDREGTGELVGWRVTFTRDHSESKIPFGTHEANYVSSPPDDSDPSDETAASIAALRASTDSTDLLPWREVAVGDHWFVDVNSFHEICWPSGALEFIDSDGTRLVTPLDERLARDLDGTFRIELSAIERVAGVKYARMELRGTLESRAAFQHEASVDLLQGLNLPYEGLITLDLHASVRGRLWWNLDAGHLDSIHIEADVTVEQEFGESELEQWDPWLKLLPDVFGTRVWSGKLTAEAHYERL